MTTITIQTDNAAFDDRGTELARILHQLADAFAEGSAVHTDTPLRDLNGNRVGWAVDREEE